jgi:hypothetical protein
MKKVFLSLIVAMVATISLSAQQIAVVKGDVTKVYNTLKDAIEGAEDGSVVYLPGGTFSIADDVKITKKLTIIGISHKVNSDNADGSTTINGDLFFNNGSSGSAIMGCYVTKNINIGDTDAMVDKILIKHCNINSVQVKNASCKDTEVNQSYLRGTSNFSNANCIITNSILHSLKNIISGYINHNVIVSNCEVLRAGFTNNYYDNFAFADVSGSNIINNFILNGQQMCRGNNNVVSNNCRGTSSWGDESIVLDANMSWKDVFVFPDGIKTASDYSLKGTWGKNAATDGTDIGIFGGTGFNKGALPPVPYIQSYEIDEQTDAEGKLNIRINVKAVTE